MAMTLVALLGACGQAQVSWTLTGHSSGVAFVGFSPDGRMLVSGAYDYERHPPEQLWLWDVGSRTVLHELEAPAVFWAVFSPNGRTVAAASPNKTVALWDAGSGRLVATLKGHTDMVRRVAFSPDGKLLASASRDKTIILWDAASGAVYRTLTLPDIGSEGVYAVLFSPDGKTLAASDDRGIRFWDVASGTLARTLATFSVGWNLALSPNWRVFAAPCESPRGLELRDLATGTLLRTLEGASFPVAFSPDEKTLVSAYGGYSAALWDAQGGGLLCTLVGHTNSITREAFSPDGRTVATGSSDRTIKLWDVSPFLALATGEDADEACTGDWLFPAALGQYGLQFPPGFWGGDEEK